MKRADQPTCFPDDVAAMVSAKDDGTMLDRLAGVHNEGIVENRRRFCAAAGVTYEQTAYQRIIYDESRTYALIAEVDNGSTTRFTPEVVADALYTKAIGVALFLPVADCVATVVYDPKRRALALVHLGRHSSYAKLAEKVVRHFVSEGSRPEDLKTWMSPHAQKDSYRLEWFDRESDPDWEGYYEYRDGAVYLDLAGFNKRLFEKSGVRPECIDCSPVDTVTDPAYFSHQMGETSGRIAVVAMMR